VRTVLLPQRNSQDNPLLKALFNYSLLRACPVKAARKHYKRKSLTYPEIRNSETNLFLMFIWKRFGPNFIARNSFFFYFMVI